MTLIAAGKIDNNSAFIISDFRVTTEDSQSDSVQKFINIEDTIYVYMAGTINLLKDISTELDGYSELIDYESIDDSNNIFVNKVHSIFKEYCHNRNDKSDLIVIYLDKKENRFKLFKMEFYMENNECVYNIINNFNSMIIGSGSIICDNGSSGFIVDTYNRAKKIADNINSLKAVEFEIKRKLEEIRENPYSELGISSVFHYTVING